MTVDGAGGRLPVPVSAYGPLHSTTLPLYDLVINGRCPEALVLADAIEAGARGFGDLRTVAFAVHLRMYALISLGRLHEAQAVGEALLKLNHDAGSVVGEAKVAADLAEVRIRLGRVDDGLRDLAWATALLEACHPQHPRLAAAMSSVGEAAKAAELYELADEAARICAASSALSETDRRAAQLQHAELLIEWGLRLDHIGHGADARLRLGRSAELTRSLLARTDQAPGEAPLAQALLALALAKLDRPEEALPISGSLLMPTRQAGQFHEARLAHLAHGIALRQLGDLTAARRELIAARQLADTGATTVSKLIFEYELASVAAARRAEEGGDVLSALRGHAQQLWNSRLERIWMLRQARSRAELETARARADEAASRDPLTGLGNRRRFEQQMAALGQLGDLHPPVSLALIDVDAFKCVNDGHSHAVGDAVLWHIAEIVRENCRADEVAVRFGGDEFAMFIQADLAVATQIADRVRRSVAERDWDEVATGLRVTLSIGVAELGLGMNARELYAEADRRLYVAKHDGRNRLAAA